MSSSQKSLYPQVDFTNPDSNSPFSKSFSSSSSSSSTMYPSIDTAAQNSSSQVPFEHVLVTVPGVLLHLIEKDSSVQLASGDLTVVSLMEGDKVVTVFARIGDQIQWPLAKDVSTVKLDESHYFFTIRVQEESENEKAEILNYGLTIATKGQERVVKELDEVLEKYSFLSVEKAEGVEGWEVLSKETSPEELNKSGEKRELVEDTSAAYWTTLAPNVEDYSCRFARWIAAGSGQVVRGILWCGDVTVDRLNWGNDYLKQRMQPGAPDSQISPQTMQRIQRVKKLTKKSESVANGLLSGVVKVSQFLTGSVVNSKPGKKFFSLLPGELVLATMDGFNKVCDAVEVAGKNVMSTSSVVTTGLVSHKYGDEAGKATNEGLDAAGHAIGTAWAVFKLRKALNPKSAIKPTTLAKAAVKGTSSQLKAKK